MKLTVFLLLIPLLVTGCASRDNSAQINANFQTFQTQSASSVEYPVIVSYKLLIRRQNNIQVEVKPRWNEISSAARMTILYKIWHRWKALNTPEEVKKSYVTVHYNGQIIAMAGYDTNGHWQLFY